LALTVFDLVVIGSGPAGEKAAVKGATMANALPWLKKNPKWAAQRWTRLPVVTIC